MRFQMNFIKITMLSTSFTLLFANLLAYSDISQIHSQLIKQNFSCLKQTAFLNSGLIWKETPFKEKKINKLEAVVMQPILDHPELRLADAASATLNQSDSYDQNALKELLRVAREIRKITDTNSLELTTLDLIKLGKMIDLDLLLSRDSGIQFQTKEARIFLPNMVRQFSGSFRAAAKVTPEKYLLIAFINTDAERLVIEELNFGLPRNRQVRVVEIKPGQVDDQTIRKVIKKLRRQISVIRAIGLREDEAFANYLIQEGLINEPFKPMDQMDQFLEIFGLNRKMVWNLAQRLAHAIDA